VAWQPKAWLDAKTALKWVEMFAYYLQRLGLSGEPTLLMSDNLDSQKTKDVRAALKKQNCRTVYGPKHGTDIWQPVDHGVGRMYQTILQEKYYDWTRTRDECADLFRNHQAPSEPRRRDLMVQWTHEAYCKLEKEREDKEKEGKVSLFESAFLRTGALVSANGGAVDDQMNPEGLVKAMKESGDHYYRDHKIETFRDLLRCSSGCDHVQTSLVTPTIPSHDTEMDQILVNRRLVELEKSTDPRAVLLMKCLKNGMKWAGSSFITFLRGGVAELLQLLSERNEDGSPAHDLDLYRDSDGVQRLGIMFVGKQIWEFASKKKGRAVTEILLTLRDGGDMLLIDQVDRFKSKFPQGTDIWGNLCLACDSSEARNHLVDSMHPGSGPPNEVSIHNALLLSTHNDVPWYVLRRQIMPTYDEVGKFIADDSYCDGRFRHKLHKRQESRLVSLQIFWKPGPVVPAPDTFRCGSDESSSYEDAASDDSGMFLLNDAWGPVESESEPVAEPPNIGRIWDAKFNAGFRRARERRARNRTKNRARKRVRLMEREDEHDEHDEHGGEVDHGLGSSDGSVEEDEFKDGPYL
jgi:hypothetical protein